MAPRPDYMILITDAALRVVGDPVADWTTIDVSLRFNEPSSGQFTAPNPPSLSEQLAPGCRVVVIRDNRILIAGPVEDWLEESSDDGDNSGDGVITVTFADDLSRVVARQCYPDPTLAPSAQTIDSWTYTGNAEQAVRALVNANAGPGALPARRVPQLALGPLANVGANVTAKADRMQPLGDVARQILDAGGSLGMRTRQSGQQILFDVYKPLDVSGKVRFSYRLGNLKYLSYQRTAPTATTAIVGGQGEGADRYLTERVNPDDEALWGRAETLVSMPGSSSAQDLADSGDRELADDASTTRVTANVADTEDQRYPRDYDVGSKVAIDTRRGPIVDVVQTVHLQAWASAGEYVAATVGSQAAVTDPAWVKVLNDINTRLGNLERNVTPA